MHLTRPSTAICVSSENYLIACCVIWMTLPNLLLIICIRSCTCGHVRFDITRCEGIELLEKGLVIDIVRTITGKCHTDLSVDPVDRSITHIDRLVGSSKPPELLEDRMHIRVVDQRLQVINAAIAKLVKKVRRQDLLLDIHAVPVCIFRKPARQLA